MLGLYAALCYCSTRLSARPTRSDIMACWKTKMEITHKWVIIDAASQPASQPACLPASQPARLPASCASWQQPGRSANPRGSCASWLDPVRCANPSGLVRNWEDPGRASCACANPSGSCALGTARLQCEPSGARALPGSANPRTSGLVGSDARIRNQMPGLGVGCQG